MTTAQAARPFPDPTMNRGRADDALSLFEIASVCNNYYALQINYSFGLVIKFSDESEEDVESGELTTPVHSVSVSHADFPKAFDDMKFATVQRFANGYDLRIKKQEKRSALECVKELFKHLPNPGSKLVAVDFYYPSDEYDFGDSYRAVSHPDGRIELFGPTKDSDFAIIAEYPSYAEFIADCDAVKRTFGK